MKAINERIAYLEKALNTLRTFRTTHKNIAPDLLLDIIVNCAEYQSELNELKQIKKANSSLF